MGEYSKRKARIDIVNRTSMALKNKTAMDAIMKELANKALPAKSAYSLAGNPKIQNGYWLKKHKLEVTPVETKLPVRCCTRSGGYIDMKRYGCHVKDFLGAKDVCTGITPGSRLCTVKEIMRCATCRSGCMFDYKRVWTSDVVDFKIDDENPIVDPDNNRIATIVKTIGGNPKQLHSAVKDVNARSNLAIRCCTKDKNKRIRLQ